MQNFNVFVQKNTWTAHADGHSLVNLQDYRIWFPSFGRVTLTDQSDAMLFTADQTSLHAA